MARVEVEMAMESVMVAMVARLKSLMVVGVSLVAIKARTGCWWW